MDDYQYSDILPLAEKVFDQRNLGNEGLSEVAVDGQAFLKVEGTVLADLSYEAFKEVNFYLRKSHLKQLNSILGDDEASKNDKFVALDLLKNANVSAGQVLPMCQDTGTAVVYAKRGSQIITDGEDQKHITDGIFRAYRDLNLRYSQLSPLSLWEETNTKNNLPAEIDIRLGKGASYELLFMAKGGGSANKSFLYQETKAILDETRMLEFLREKIASIGTAACPPYHLAVVIGGTTAEFALKTAKLASAHYLDELPTSGGEAGHGFRDLDFEQKVFELTQQIGFGAQFGGKYFCHDVRVVRLPRHNGSLPIAIAVSCSADRQVLARIDASGIYLEELEHDPAQHLPDEGVLPEQEDQTAINVDLNLPMAEILEQLSGHPTGTRVSLSGPMVVARDIAHARLRTLLEAGQPLPDYVKDHPIYYAGPSKTPEGYVTGSFGPTTAGRMDTYVSQLQAAGGSMVMLAKGNRSSVVAQSCGKYGGFYLGTIGGPAALIAQENIHSVEVIDHSDLGMEAIFKIQVENFPAFIVIDNQGNDLFKPDDKKLVSLSKTRTVGN
ncbi:MAG: FumA C-terminus/TtdB family hydratase beta subunit [Aquiluna sp.]|jgi:fumarate hydratase, class I|nr:FumA C-terminus/TtdB family hydratase beta subunit [Aquiluna sp.]MDP5026466.1 FumA C-terminus/TtdB family hydratase beta subunit [Aquiluna sp.]